MAISVKHLLYTHVPRLVNVRAIRVTARNHVNVANWCGGLAIKRVDKHGEESNHRIRVKKLMAQVGDWVVREEVGLDESTNKPVYKFYRVKADEFAENYGKVLPK